MQQKSGCKPIIDWYPRVDLVHDKVLPPYDVIDTEIDNIKQTMGGYFSVRPFLKWAGGKYHLLKHIQPLLPDAKRFIEPFTGAGSVFLNVNYRHYLLGEINADLVNLYHQLKKGGQDFIEYTETFFVPSNNCSEYYYEARTLFNETKEPCEKAALFLYLNRHGYNGLCRYNSRGVFNVPMGSFKKPYFPKKEMFFFAEQLKKATVKQQDFLKTMSAAKSGEVVYCDPPYVPLSETANFTQYSQLDFTLEDQMALARSAVELVKRGVTVLISNHDTPLTRKLYKGAEIISFPVARTISRDTDQRCPVHELIAVFSPK